MTKHYLARFQESFVSMYFWYYGHEAGVNAMDEFEKTGKLGQAMINHRPTHLPYKVIVDGKIKAEFYDDRVALDYMVRHGLVDKAEIRYDESDDNQP